MNTFSKSGHSLSDGIVTVISPTNRFASSDPCCQAAPLSGTATSLGVFGVVTGSVLCTRATIEDPDPAPLGPVAPVAPVEPAGPSLPVGPVGPVAPVLCFGPLIWSSTLGSI